MKICTEEGCDRTDVRARGLCGMHLQRYYVETNTSPCTTQGCKKTNIRARGLCDGHLHEFYNAGGGERRGTVKVCVVNGCERTDYKANGMCVLHDSRVRQGGSTELTLHRFDPNSGVKWCGHCKSHRPVEDFNVDHDHSCCPGYKSCGKCVRGILCTKCNVGMGMLRDSIEVIEGALQYLRDWQERKQQIESEQAEEVAA